MLSQSASHVVTEVHVTTVHRVAVAMTEVHAVHAVTTEAHAVHVASRQLQQLSRTTSQRCSNPHFGNIIGRMVRRPSFFFYVYLQSYGRVEENICGPADR